MRYNFDELMALAETEAGGVDVPTRPTIVKELLHYDILYTLSRSHLSERLVFQGGTALRLCYGGQRYSEDLDFVCGRDAREPFTLEDMESLLREHIADRYGLTLEVKPPADDRHFDNTAVTVKRWYLSIQIPGFAAAQKIHFEVCNVPSYQNAPTLVQPRYGFLSDVYSDIALHVESLDEILADKVVALIARRYIKARDLWDLRWLDQKGLVPDTAMITNKLHDYGVTGIEQRMEATVARLQSPAANTQFAKEMLRFVTPSLGQRFRDNPHYGEPWLAHAKNLLDRLRPHLAQT